MGIRLATRVQRQGEQRLKRAARRPSALLWFAVAIGLGVLVLWVSGYEPWVWWRAHEIAAAARVVPPRVAPRGPISVVQPTPLGTDSSVSAVPLALHLTGTRLGRNSREGYANIGVNVLSPQTYRAGAVLANGARLEEIYADYVVLERDHRHTSLYIEGHASPEAADPAATSLLTVGGATPVPAAVANSRDRLTQSIRIAPVFDGDHFQALVLYPPEHGEVFVQLGLQPGDRLTAIDGVRLKDAKGAVAEIRRLSEGAWLNATIERGGRAQTVLLNGSLLKSPGTRN
jgi:type II secretion system protein C